MSQTPSEPGRSRSHVTAEVDIGETFTLVLDGKQIDLFLSDNVFAVDPKTIHGRMAIRAYAYSIAADDPSTAKAILAAVGREG